MPDYSKSKIYKIVCNITGLVYIGSTCQTLCGRLQDHKKTYKRYLNEKYHYVSSFKIIENNSYDIILHEYFFCERKEQLHARERFFIENTECVNKYIPTRTQKEWREDNKEQIKKEKSEYYFKNKEKIRKKQKEYNKEWSKNNKEKISEYNKQRYIKNKEKLTPPENLI